MSKSYKRHPVCKDSSNTCNKKDKRSANKKVRKYTLSLTGKSKDYKKISESWDISDYRFWMSSESYAENWEEMFSSKEEAIQKWKKYYRRK